VLTSSEIARETELFGSVGRLLDLKTIQVLRAAEGSTAYLETNHQFIKNFSSAAVHHFGERLRVLHLVRSAVDVAISFHRISSIPGITPKGKKYLLDPESDSNCISLQGFSREVPPQRSDILRCLWYWYETEARVARFRSVHPDVDVRVVRTEELNDYRSTVRLFNDLDLAFDEEQLRTLIGTRANRKLHKGDGDVDRQSIVALDKDFRSYVVERYGCDHIRH
jgi:hypothetical protein